MSESKSPSIKVNCCIYWAFTNKVAEMSGKYEVALCNLSDAAVTNLNGIGLEVRHQPDKKPEQGHFIVCKSSLPMTVYDREGVEILEPIGNGSKGIATIGPYDWTFKNKSGVSASLKRLVVTDLIALSGYDDDDAPVF